MSRRKERELAFKVLFAHEFNPIPLSEQLDFLTEEEEYKKSVTNYVRQLASYCIEKKDEFEIWEGNKKILPFPSPAGYKGKILKAIVEAKKPLAKRGIFKRCGEEIKSFHTYIPRLNKDLEKYKFKIIRTGRKYSIISLK